MVFASNATNLQPWLPGVVGIIIALFGGGGVAALIKSRPEGSKILIDAAAGVVVVQTSVITELRSQLDESRVQISSQYEILKKAQEQIDELRGHIAEMSILRSENDLLKVRVSDLELENGRLLGRVAELEHQNQNNNP